MSRLGRAPVQIPKEVTINIENNTVKTSGPKGDLTVNFHRLVSVSCKDDTITVTRKNDTKFAKSLHGTTQRLISNNITGVTQGYKKTLELVGTGYRVTKQADKISLALGFSHPIEFQPPPGIEISIEGSNLITVEGIDKQSVGETAAKIRGFKPPEPYKGKGIRYQGELVRRKAGKAAKTAA